MARRSAPRAQPCSAATSRPRRRRPAARSSRTRSRTRRSRRSSPGSTKESSSDMPDILVYALHYEGAINKNSLGAVSEAASLASQIGGEAHAVVVGEGVSDDLASSLGSYGVTKVFRAEAPEGLAQPVVDVMAKIMSEQGHQYALFGGGLLGFEIGAGLAARLGAGVTMEVTDVKVADGKLVAERPILQDSSISESHYKGKGIIICRL